MESSLVILYGSQTGNAEDVAKRIGQQAKTLGYGVLVQTMDDFPLKSMPKQKLIFFICSTTGHGQEPENMRNFYNFIRRRELPADCLTNLNYVVYGLGDSSYAKFNYVSKILFKRLKECGAKPLQELVAADEQHQYGCDGSIYPRLDEFWTKLQIENLLVKHNGVPKESYIVQKYSTENCANTSEKFSNDFVSKHGQKTGTCILNQRVTPEIHFQDTRFIRFRVDNGVSYEPGDVCTIYPENCDEDILKFVELLNLNQDERISVKKVDPNFMINYLYDFIPNGLTIRDLIKHYLDIRSVPKRSFFEYLWPLSDVDHEKDKLKEFATTEGQEDVYDYCIRPKRSILEVLLDFPSAVKNIRIKHLFDLIPPIKPRSFSIASSVNAYPDEIHLIVGVVKYQTRLKEPRKGLCSNYLARLGSDDSFLRFYIGKSSFKLPRDLSEPIIMIGPGLGIAPFRSFLQERALNDTQYLVNHLYFGCRFSERDFYFKDELDKYCECNTLRMRVAFSREGNKQYVQDLIKQDSVFFKKLIEEDKATVYVAGNSKLPEDLRSLLARILFSDEGDSGHSMESDRKISMLEAQNRIQYDCW